MKNEATEAAQSGPQSFKSARFWVALTLLFLVICLLVRAFAPFFAKKEVSPSTASNMMRMGSLFSEYSKTSRANRWPSLAANNHIWAPDLAVLYPDFFTNTDILVASEHPDAEHIRAALRAVLEGANPDYDTAAGLLELSFAYIGFVVRDEIDFDRLLDARASGLTIDPGIGKRLTPLNMDGMRCLGSNPLHPAYPPDIDPTDPVLVEIWAWKTMHDTAKFEGTNVLFMDGHVEFVPLGTFPVVPSVMDALCGFSPPQ